MAKKAKFNVQFDGPDVHPKTLDAIGALELVTSYLTLLRDIAQDDANELTFTGIDLVDKCARFQVTPSNPPVARAASLRAAAILSGTAEPPRGAVNSTMRCRAAITKLPRNYSTTVSYRSWKRQLRAEEVPTGQTPYSSVTLRARPMRVGGAVQVARFEAPSEASQFTLNVTVEEARELGAHLYEEVECMKKSKSRPASLAAETA